MKKFLMASSLLATSLTLVSIANANNVGVWNSQIAIGNSNYAKAKIASVKNSVQPKQQQLLTYKANLQRLQQQLDSQRGKLSEAQKQDIANQIQLNLKNYDDAARYIELTLSTSEDEVLKKISPVIQSITNGIIKQRNIDVLIDSRDRNITYVSPQWDITSEVTQKLNEQVR